jgi:hypothetical protein
MKFLYLLLLFSFFCFGQIQIGDPVNGLSEGDYYGEKLMLSSDGSTVVVSSRYHGSYGGLVRVYKNISGYWVQQGQDLTGLTTPSSWFGSEIAISADGTIIAVSSINSPITFFKKVRIYENTAGQWVQIGEISDSESGNIISLSADGNTIAIGSPSENATGNTIPTEGLVKVYSRTLGNWIQNGQTIIGFSANMQFGKVLALSGDGMCLAIGSSSYSDLFNYGGITQVYKNVSGQWIQTGQNIYGQQNYDYLGSSVSLSFDGNILAVGAPYYGTSNGLHKGFVSIFKNNNDVWEEYGQKIIGQAGDFLGSSVSLASNGNSIAIGSPQNSNNGYRSGNVKFFRYSQNTWSQIGNTINGQAIEDYTGECVSLSATGSVLAVSASKNDNNGQNSGQVRMYDLSLLLDSDSFVASNFSIFPNPVSDIVNINLNNGLEIQKVNIYSVSGQLLKIEKSKSFKINELSKGTYFIEVITNKGKATKTIVVK